MHIRLSSVFASLVVVFALLGCKGDPKPGENEFQEANSKINVFEGEVGFGNTPACTALAKKFAVRIKADEKENFEGGEDENTATTQGNFMTYCQETASDVLLLEAHAESRATIGMVLEAFGFRPRVASGAGEAMAMATQRPAVRR